MEYSNSLALNRPKRQGAGSKMNEILNINHEVDEFYSTKYGGFNELEDDSDFSDSNSSDSENVIDSDFDIDENVDEKDSDEEEKNVLIEEKREKLKNKSLAYKDSRRVNNQRHVSSRNVDNKPFRSIPNRASRSIMISSKPVSKNLRKSTIKSTRVTNDLLDERTRKKKRVSRQQYKKLSQAEMLREAEYTEIENLKSLEAFKNLEIEKTKKSKINKVSPNIPMIKYHSYTEFVEVEQVSDHIEINKEKMHKSNQTIEKQSRTIITFPDNETFGKYFKHSSLESSDLLSSVQATADRTRSRRICPITNLPARYVDPLTGVPYSNRMAFAMIRHMYVRYLKSSHLHNDPRVKNFVEKYVPFKKTAININQVNNVALLSKSTPSSIVITNSATY